MMNNTEKNRENKNDSFIIIFAEEIAKAKENKDYLNELYSNEGTCFSIFRQLQATSKQFLINFIKLSNIKSIVLTSWLSEDIKKDVSKLKELKIKIDSNNHDQYMFQNDHEIIKLGILYCDYSKKSNPSENKFSFYFNEKFRENMILIFERGLSMSYEVNDQAYSLFADCDQEAIRRWKKLYGILKDIGQLERNNTNNNLEEVLLQANLIKKEKVQKRDQNNKLVSDNFTPHGFKFILSSAKNQLNTFLCYYIKYMHTNKARLVQAQTTQQTQKERQQQFSNQLQSNKQSMVIFAKIVNFIINLSLQLPGEACIRTAALNDPLFKEIFDDFKIFGLVLESNDKKYFTCTKLLHNFVFDDLELKVDIDCKIIVETNFRIYIDLTGVAQEERNNILELIKKFSEPKQWIADLIVAELTEQSVKEAYNKAKLNPDLIIDFFKKCINPERKKYLEERKKHLQLNQEKQQNIQKKPLKFLKLYNNKVEQSVIPANIVQSLQLWYEEKDIDNQQQIINNQLHNKEDLDGKKIINNDEETYDD